jgi:serine phosphatase RsbU (regulator of sigma subunit)
VLDLRREKHFATVLCGLADVTRREITFANAGHLPPLVIDGGSATFVETAVGPPIGVTRSAAYGSVTVAMPPGSTLLLYTDGLVERRNETLDDGLERLRTTAATADGPLETMLSRVLTELTPGGADDDTAMLGLRWS